MTVNDDDEIKDQRETLQLLQDAGLVHPMTTNGFEPDYEKLWDAAFQGAYEDGDTPDLGAVIAAYEAQREAAGEVRVRREDVTEACGRLDDHWRYLSTWVPDWRAAACMELANRLRADLIAKEQP